MCKLSNLFNGNSERVCSHDMFSTCKRGEECRFKHLEKTNGNNDLISIFKDPGKLIPRNKIIKELKKKFKSIDKFFIVGCKFKLQNHCNNECHGRKGMIIIKHNGSNLKLDYCYGNSNNNRITIALHIDIEYTIRKDKLIKKQIIPYLNLEDSSDSSDSSDEEVDINNLYFPKIDQNSSISNEKSFTDIKEDPSWNIIKSPEIEEKKVIIMKTKGNEVKNLKFDMSADVGTIVNHTENNLEYEEYTRDTYPEFVPYTNNDIREFLNNMAHVSAY